MVHLNVITLCQLHVCYCNYHRINVFWFLISDKSEAKKRRKFNGAWPKIIHDWEAHNELADKIWAQTEQRFVGKFCSINRRPRNSENLLEHGQKVNQVCRVPWWMYPPNLITMPWAVRPEMRGTQKGWQTDGRTDGQALSYSHPPTLLLLLLLLVVVVVVVCVCVCVCGGGGGGGGGHYFLQQVERGWLYRGAYLVTSCIGGLSGNRDNTHRGRVTRDAFMCQSSCACCAKPSSELMLGYCLLNHWEHFTVILASKYGATITSGATKNSPGLLSPMMNCPTKFELNSISGFCANARKLLYQSGDRE